MCRSTGALQVLHLATCYSLRGYPGRPRTLQPREPLVNDRFWCSTGRQTSFACVIGLGFAALSFCVGRSVGGRILGSYRSSAKPQSHRSIPVSLTSW
jgi:hypothetical protein